VSGPSPYMVTAMKCKAQTAAGVVIEFIVDMCGYTMDEARFLS